MVIYGKKERKEQVCSNICRSEIKRRAKEIIIAVTSTYFIVSLLHSRLRFMTSNFLLHRIMAVNLCISANLSSDHYRFCRTFFLFFFFIFLQFSINYRWNNLLKCSNCFEANFISIHLFHGYPADIVSYSSILFCCEVFFYYFIFVNMQLTSVFRYWSTFLLKICLHYQYTTIFYIIYRPIIQHKRYISIQRRTLPMPFHLGELMILNKFQKKETHLQGLK